MSNYPEYDWIQRSIDATNEEIGKTDDLIEAMKREIPPKYYVLPESIIRLTV